MFKKNCETKKSKQWFEVWKFYVNEQVVYGQFLLWLIKKVLESFLTTENFLIKFNLEICNLD